MTESWENSEDILCNCDQLFDCKIPASSQNRVRPETPQNSGKQLVWTHRKPERGAEGQGEERMFMKKESGP